MLNGPMLFPSPYFCTYYVRLVRRTCSATVNDDATNGRNVNISIYLEFVSPLRLQNASVSMLQ